MLEKDLEQLKQAPLFAPQQQEDDFDMPLNINFEKEQLDRQVDEQKRLAKEQEQKEALDAGFASGINGVTLSQERVEELKALGMKEDQIKKLPTWDDMQSRAYGTYEAEHKFTEQEIKDYVDQKLEERAKRGKSSDEATRLAAERHARTKVAPFRFTNRVNQYLIQKNTRVEANKLTFEGMDNYEIASEQNEYNTVYQEKKFGWGKTREDKIKNKNSRLHAKDLLAKSFENIDMTQVMTEAEEKKYTAVTEEPDTEEKMRENIAPLGDLTSELLNINYDGINFSSSAELLKHATTFERNQKLIEMAEKGYAANPGFLLSMSQKRQQEVKKVIRQGKAVSAYYRVKKMIYTNPYYRTHYNEEISMNATKDDAPEKQVLSKLLRTAYYLSKNLDHLRGLDGGAERLDNKSALPVPEGNDYTKEMEAEICVISYKTSDYENMSDSTYRELSEQVNRYEYLKNGDYGNIEKQLFIQKNSLIPPEDFGRIEKLVASKKDEKTLPYDDSEMVKEYKRMEKMYDKLLADIYLNDKKKSHKEMEDLKSEHVEKIKLTPAERGFKEKLKTMRSGYKADYESAQENLRDHLRDRFGGGSYEERRDQLITKLEKESAKLKQA